MLLCAATILAIAIANSSLGAVYIRLLDIPFSIHVGSFGIAKPLLLWVNDGLMAIFFLAIGLEVKREALERGMSTLSKATLPIIAALGGMIGPVLVYVAFTSSDPAALRGWAIPAATDIAFALGIFALLGARVPHSLKIFLLALAVIDDLGIIIIIAVFYTSDLSVLALALAGLGTAVIALMNLAGVSRRSAYILVGIFIWVCVLKSGVHATLAGVIIGLAVPMRLKDGSSPLAELEHDLHPWVAYAILPIFAFANAGVRLTDIHLADLLHPAQFGIAFGLLIGKQAGVFGFVWTAVRLGLSALPDGATWRHIYGLALLTGIGFTMSLFVSTLAFPVEAYDADVRVAILIGSLASGMRGLFRAVDHEAQAASRRDDCVQESNNVGCRRAVRPVRQRRRPYPAPEVRRRRFCRHVAYSPGTSSFYAAVSNLRGSL